jgi:hypothetical protein
VDVDTSCRSVTLTELEALGAVQTSEGQSALALAAAIDSGRSLMAVPAMVKELRSTMDALRERTPKAEDGVDDFSKRRRQRLAGRIAAAGE